MKKLLILAILGISMVAGSSLFAGEIPDRADHIYAKVSSFYITTEGSYVIKLDTSTLTSAGSYIEIAPFTKRQSYLAIPSNAENKKEMYATLMLAKAMDWRVWFKVSAIVENDMNTINYILAPY